MPPSHLNRVLRYLRRTVEPNGSEPSDGELLGRFVVGREEIAFATLVRRHGAMVLGVCRRILSDHDAEDAFQATFLVLARKAESVRKTQSVASWLYGVALRVAQQARSAAAIRRRYEEKTNPRPAPSDPLEEAEWRELRPLLDKELAQLPEKYRAPVVLCYLEGKTNEEAARLLGWTKGTVSGRLARARDLLRGRLLRRGLALSAGGLAALLIEKTSALASAALIETTVKAGLGGGSSAAALALAGEIMRAMFVRKLMVISGALLGLVLLGAGTGIIGQQAFAEKETNTPKPASTPGALFGDADNLAKTEAASESLDGTWSAVGIEEDGEKAPAEVVKKFRMVIKGHEMTINPDTENRRASFKLYPGKTLNAIVMTPADGPAKGKPVVGIYSLEKGRLTLCMDRRNGTAKPTEFATSPGSGLALLILTRETEPPVKEETRRTDKDSRTLWWFNTGATVRGLAVAPDGKSVAVAWKNQVSLLDSRTGKEHTRFELKNCQIQAIAFSPDGKRMAIAGSTGEDKPVGVVKVVDLTGTLVFSSNGHGIRATAVAFSPDGKRLASSGMDGSVTIWDGETGKEMIRITLPFKLPLKGNSAALAFSPDGKLLAAGGADESFQLYDSASGKAVRSFTGEKGSPITAVAWSPDGKLLASVADNEFRLWDVTTGNPPTTISGKEKSGASPSVAFSPDGSRLALAGRLVRFAKLNEGRLLWELSSSVESPNGPITHLKMTPDGTGLVTASEDGTVRCWKLP
jgi:RNA polymerase sigma factor (sigma-70 family)